MNWVDKEYFERPNMSHKLIVIGVVNCNCVTCLILNSEVLDKHGEY